MVPGVLEKFSSSLESYIVTTWPIPTPRYTPKKIKQTNCKGMFHSRITHSSKTKIQILALLTHCYISTLGWMICKNKGKDLPCIQYTEGPHVSPVMCAILFNSHLFYPYGWELVWSLRTCLKLQKMVLDLQTYTTI